MASVDQELLQKALSKIEELETRLAENGKSSSKASEGSKQPEEADDDDPIITPDGEKVTSPHIYI